MEIDSVHVKYGSSLEHIMNEEDILVRNVREQCIYDIYVIQRV